MAHYIYMVRCKDNSLYTGSTGNITTRIHQHNFSKLRAKSIRGKLPVRLVYSETFKTKSQALKREIEIKSWRKEKKEELIKSSKI